MVGGKHKLEVNKSWDETVLLLLVIRIMKLASSDTLLAFDLKDETVLGLLGKDINNIHTYESRFHFASTFEEDSLTFGREFIANRLVHDLAWDTQSYSHEKQAELRQILSYILWLNSGNNSDSHTSLLQSSRLITGVLRSITKKLYKVHSSMDKKYLLLASNNEKVVSRVLKFYGTIDFVNFLNYNISPNGHFPWILCCSKIPSQSFLRLVLSESNRFSRNVRKNFLIDDIDFIQQKINSFILTSNINKDNIQQDDENKDGTNEANQEKQNKNLSLNNKTSVKYILTRFIHDLCSEKENQVRCCFLFHVLDFSHRAFIILCAMHVYNVDFNGSTCTNRVLSINYDISQM